MERSKKRLKVLELLPIILEPHVILLPKELFHQINFKDMF